MGKEALKRTERNNVAAKVDLHKYTQQGHNKNHNQDFLPTKAAVCANTPFTNPPSPGCCANL